MNGTSIAFAHYKNGELLGYRQDTFGTLGKDWAKIYTYSKEQVEIVLKGIRYNLGNKKQSFGEALKRVGADPEVADMIKEHEDKIYEDGQKAGAFEVRVVKCPSKIHEKNFNVATAQWETDPWGEYPIEEMRIWMEHPETHEVIETHYFSMEGQVNLQ